MIPAQLEVLDSGAYDLIVWDLYGTLINPNEADQVGMLALFDWVVPLFKKLKEKGITMAVLSTMSTRSIEAYLAHHQLEAYIQFVGGPDKGLIKPDGQALNYIIDYFAVSKPRAVMIGDSSVDRDCANNAGVEFILLP